MAQTIKVPVTCSKNLGGNITKTFEWEQPDDFAEAEALYKAEAWKACLTKLKTNFQDRMRKKLDAAIIKKVSAQMAAGEMEDLELEE